MKLRSKPLDGKAFVLARLYKQLNENQEESSI